MYQYIKSTHARKKKKKEKKKTFSVYKKQTPKQFQHVRNNSLQKKTKKKNYDYISKDAINFAKYE
jgi:hypothetical protein